MLDFVSLGFFGVVGVCFFVLRGYLFIFFLIIVEEKYRFLDCNVSGPFKICSLELDDSSD